MKVLQEQKYLINASDMFCIQKDLFPSVSIN